MKSRFGVTGSASSPVCALQEESRAWPIWRSCTGMPIRQIHYLNLFCWTLPHILAYRKDSLTGRELEEGTALWLRCMRVQAARPFSSIATGAFSDFQGAARMA